MKSLKTKIQELELLTVTASEPGNTCSDYLTGLANGMRLALSVIKENEPEFLDCPKVKLTIFQKMQILNEGDTVNKTKHLGVFNELVEAKMTKPGGEITIGVDRETLLTATLNQEKLCFLLIAVDRAEFDKLKQP